MPEELVVILVVLGVAGWIVYAVLKAALDTTRAAHKGIVGSIARAREAGFQKKKARLQACIRISIPAELERTARTIAKFETAFADRRSNSNWVAHRPTWQKVTFKALAAPRQNPQSTEMNVAELQAILRSNTEPWHEKETRMLERDCLYPSQLPSSSQRGEPEAFVLPEISMDSAVFEPSSPNIREKDLDRFFGNERREVEQYNEKRRLSLSKYQELANSVAAWNESERQRWKQYRDSCTASENEELARFHDAARAYKLECIAENTRLRKILDGFRAGQKEQVLQRLDYILSSIEWPVSMPRVWQVNYDEERRILIVEIELPNVVHRPPIKFVEQRIGLVAKPLNQKERGEFIPQFHPAIMLRAALEIFRNAESSVVQLLALNGWVSFHHPHTGLDTRAYTAALLAGNQTSSHVWIGGASNNTLDTTTKYFDTGVPVMTTTPNGTSSFRYDPTQTFTVQTNYPGVLSTSATYDQQSTAVLTGTGYNSGQTTQVKQYDFLLNPTSVLLPDQTTATFTQSPTLSTSVLTNSAAQTTAQVKTQYDSYGRTSEVLTYNGNSSSGNPWYEVDSCYDASGMLSFQSLPYAVPNFSSSKLCSTSGVGGASYSYDALGRTTQVITSDGTATTTYQGRATLYADVNNVQTVTQYDALGRLSEVCEVSSNSNMPGSGSPIACNTDYTGTNSSGPSGFLTTYAYDLANHKTTITQGAQMRVFQTDAAGRTTYTSEPERGITQYSYAYNSGLTVTRTRPKPNQTSASATTNTVTQYDSVGRPINVSYGDGTPTKTFTYDETSSSGPVSYGSSQGQLTTASTVSPSSSMVLSTTSLGYDISGHIVGTSQCFPGRCGTASFNATRGYAYDPVLGTRTQETYLQGASTGTAVATTMTYTAAGELSGMSNSQYGSVLSNLTQSAYGPSNYTLGNGLNGVLSYDSLGRASGYSLCSGSTSSGCSGGSAMYTTSEIFKGTQTKSVNDSVNGRFTTTYDEFNRLAAVVPPLQRNPRIPPSGPGATYIYDRYGNRWSQTMTQNSSGPSPSVSFNTSTNQIMGNSYDAAGNMTSDGASNYTFDAEGNVVTMVGANSSATYAYDALNHRVRETVTMNSVTTDTDYSFNTDGLRTESWSATSASPVLLAANSYWGSTMLATYNSSNGTFYMHQDLLGTKRLMTDVNGNAAGSYTSLPFGDNYVASGDDEDAAHFAQLDHDAESSTEHAQFRQYSSNLATWMSPDPYDGSYDSTNPQSYNRYSYTDNNPLSFIDPLGLMRFCYYIPNAPVTIVTATLRTTPNPIILPGNYVPYTYTQRCVDLPDNNPSGPPHNGPTGTSGGGGGYVGHGGGGPNPGPNNPQQPQPQQPKPEPKPGWCTALNHAGNTTVALGGATFLWGTLADAGVVTAPAGVALQASGGIGMAVGGIGIGIADAGLALGICH